jgi:nucleoside-diphosphate-sugar epimerase
MPHPVYGSAGSLEGVFCGSSVRLKQLRRGTNTVEPAIYNHLTVVFPTVGRVFPGGAAANMVMQQQNPVVGKGEGVSSFVPIGDAAIGTVAALTAEPGVYNLVDDDPSPQAVWLPAFANFVGAPVPPSMNEAAVRAIAGEDAVYYATKLSGASNEKAKRAFGWKPRRLEWLAE